MSYTCLHTLSLHDALPSVFGNELFLLIVAKRRAEDDFSRADTSRQSATGQVFEPLPQPDSGDAGLDNAPPAADDAAPSARIVETQPPPPPPGPADRKSTRLNSSHSCASSMPSSA